MEKLKKALPFTFRFLVIVPCYLLVTAAGYYFGFLGDAWKWAAFVGGISLCVAAMTFGLTFDAARALQHNPTMRVFFNGVPATLILLLLVPGYFVIATTINYSGLVGEEWKWKAIAGGFMLLVGAVIFGLIADGARALWHRR